MESRPHTPLPDENDKAFIDQVLEHFYQSLSDFERANGCLRGAGYVNHAPIMLRFPVTYPLALVLAQSDFTSEQHQERPLNVRINMETDPRSTLPMYVRGFRFPITIIEYVEEEAEQENRPDDKADVQKRVVPEAVREVVDYYESLSPELKYLLTVVEWGCAGDLGDKIEEIRRQLPEYTELEKDRASCDERIKQIKNNKKIDNKEKKILLENLTKKKNILTDRVMSLDPILLARAKQANAAVLRKFAEQLNIHRIHDCIRMLEHGRPEFMLYVRALTKLEIFDCQGSQQQENSKQRYINEIKAKAENFGNIKVVSMTELEKEEYFRELHLECEGAYNLLAGQRNSNVHHASAGALKTLELLAKFKRDDLHNSDLSKLITDLNLDVGTLRDFFNLPLAPKVERVLDTTDDMYIEDEVPSNTHTTSSATAPTPKHFLRFILDNLPDSARKLVVSEELLENLKALANESSYWEKQPNGHITQQNLWLLINALIKARAKLIWQSGDPVNARDVSYEDADQVLQYCESLVRDEIAAAGEQGIKLAKLVNRLEDYRNKVAEVKASAQSIEEKTEKLLKLAQRIAEIPLEVSSKKSVDTTEVVLNEALNQLMDKMIKLLASDITKLDPDYINAIIETVDANPQIVVISDMLNSIRFVQACSNVLTDDKLNDKSRKQELVRLLKDTYEFKREVVFNMTGCNLSDCKMLNITRNHLLLNHTNLSNVLMQGCIYPGINCIGANMQAIKIVDCDLTGGVLAGSNLSGARLSQVRLMHANLDNCVLHDLKSTDICFKDVSLRGAELIHLDKKYSLVEWEQIFSDWERWEVPGYARQYNLLMNMNASGRYTPAECQQIAEMFTRPIVHSPKLLSSPLLSTLFHENQRDKKTSHQPPSPK